MALLCLAVAEIAMRYRDRPATVVSGWRATVPDGPFNQLGYRGRPWPPRRPLDFVVVLTGAESVECGHCPSDETLDLILERALRPYNPNVRVIALGARGYGQDQGSLALQEYLAGGRADLVISWISPAEDVPRNTFRSGQPLPGLTRFKPTFTLHGAELRGPTEGLGQSVYHSKLSTWFMPRIFDAGRRWNWLLPAADPGATAAPGGIPAQSHIDDVLEEQRSPWSIWMRPRPARVQYGIDLTRALLRRMRELATLRGGRFTVLMNQPAAGDTPIGLEHAGHWFLADPAARDASIAEVTEGFDQIVIAPELNPSVDAERQRMAWLAETLNQRNLLNNAGPARARH
ncbi:MAG: hypothetical protein EXR07_02550 [Acetobacteraceae bacterium]|nr:hypothetical protein [Acetobacteraceae bacterium]